MVGAVLPVAPVQCGAIQVSNVPENPPNKKVLLYKPHQPFHFALREGMPGLAEPRLKPDCFHKGFVVLLPDGMPLKVPVENNTLHIVCQDILGDAHISKGMDHANEEILLFRIREELYIPLTAVVTDHGKAGYIVFAAVVVYHFGEAPVHLVGFSRLGREPAASAALWRYQLPLGRDKVLVRLNIPLDGTEATLEPNRLQPL